MRIRNLFDPESGINIPDPQHWKNPGVLYREVKNNSNLVLLGPLVERLSSRDAEARRHRDLDIFI
jgi:hypothetical protein